MLSPQEISLYLERIGYTGSLDPTVETLRDLHRAHLLTVPFENLDIRAGVAITIDPNSFFDKIVRRNRGGFCYEMNGLFASLLTSLGFDVTLLSARVAREDGTFGPDYDHLALLVKLDRPYLVDVGFGHSFIEPLLFVEDVESIQGRSRYRNVRRDDRWILKRAEGDEEWKPQYSFTDSGHELGEFTGMCDYFQSAPDSHFTQKSLATRLTPNGRITLVDRKLTIDEDGIRTVRELDDSESTEDMLRSLFGLILP